MIKIRPIKDRLYLAGDDVVKYVEKIEAENEKLRYITKAFKDSIEDNYEWEESK